MPFPTTAWTRIRQGDVNYIVRRYWEPVFQSLLKRRVPREDARELTQDVLVVVANKLKEMDPGRNQKFRSFVCAVARNKYLMWRRSQRAQKNAAAGGVRSLDAENAPEVADPKSVSFDALFDQHWGTALLNRAFERLAAKNPHYARLLQRHAEGFSHAQIAEALGMSVRSVTSAVTRARAQLKREILAELKDYCAPGELEGELSALRGLGFEVTPR
jgi:RNA polymerase sigma factor (sigma-70 family)